MSTSEAAVRERLTRALQERDEEIADRWVELQMEQALLYTDIGEAELREEADALISALVPGLDSDVPVDRVVITTRGLHDAVWGLSLRRARGGYAPTATSLAVLALKEALLEAVQRDTREGEELLPQLVRMNRLLDVAGALSFETFVEGREEIIRRQSQQLLELSTPVVGWAAGVWRSP